MKLINEIGNVYGYLTVVERAENKDSRAMWKCKCKCGNEVIVSGKSLRSGRTKSCGCYRKEVTTQKNIDRGGGDLTGQRFGKLTVLKFSHYITRANGHRDRVWLCQCDCGNTCEVVHRYLRFGDTGSCGCSHSIGESVITRLLREKNVKFQTEYTFKDLVVPYNNIPYRFDFALLDEENKLKCLIEYHGSIHYYANNSGWNTEEALKERQERDRIKYEYCVNNNIKIYYINYKHDIEKELDKILNEQL